MKNLLSNWKTTFLGAAVIVITLLQGKGKIDASSAAAITSGLGLILAKDSDKTGVINE
mgnify:CR=1 FL=1